MNVAFESDINKFRTITYYCYLAENV